MKIDDSEHSLDEDDMQQSWDNMNVIMLLTIQQYWQPPHCSILARHVKSGLIHCCFLQHPNQNVILASLQKQPRGFPNSSLWVRLSQISLAKIL